jgi:hypothetical protein
MFFSKLASGSLTVHDLRNYAPIQDSLSTYNYNGKN